MSTFKGIVTEFPLIRVDYFRKQPDHPPPLASFLSHIHSDHLAGLETYLGGPFIYCAPATSKMLLKLQTSYFRVNAEILERQVRKYDNLARLLKPLPLDTPTVLHLTPTQAIQVTLLDANHCPGSVMFRDGRAVLYTGDVRSEPWFVNALARNPCLVEYSSRIKTLDKIYLDTSFLGDVHFQTKAEGIEELLRKVGRYPEDTIFHFQAWTYGYEDVWTALSKFLNSRVHVDAYKLGVYQSLKVKDKHTGLFGTEYHASTEAPRLVGLMCGNEQKEGCLTSDWADPKIKIHSCETGNYCDALKVAARDSRVVWIQPIIAHLPDGVDIIEVGIGGGGGDLEQVQNSKLECQSFDLDEIQLIFELIRDQDDLPEDVLRRAVQFILRTLEAGRDVPLGFDISKIGDEERTGVRDAIQSMANKLALGDRKKAVTEPTDGTLPNRIYFPYSRHSSYAELCGLVDKFKPRDIWPCTESHREWHDAGYSVEGLFGRHSSGVAFVYDEMTKVWVAEHPRQAVVQEGSQSTTMSELNAIREEQIAPAVQEEAVPTVSSSSSGVTILAEASFDPIQLQPLTSPQRKRGLEDFQESGAMTAEDFSDESLSQQSNVSVLTERGFERRREAFEAAILNTQNGGWAPIGLISTSDNHSAREPEIGGD